MTSAQGKAGKPAPPTPAEQEILAKLDALAKWAHLGIGYSDWLVMNWSRIEDQAGRRKGRTFDRRAVNEVREHLGLEPLPKPGPRQTTPKPGPGQTTIDDHGA